MTKYEFTLILKGSHELTEGICLLPGVTTVLRGQRAVSSRLISTAKPTRSALSEN